MSEKAAEQPRALEMEGSVCKLKRKSDELGCHEYRSEDLLEKTRRLEYPALAIKQNQSAKEALHAFMNNKYANCLYLHGGEEDVHRLLVGTFRSNVKKSDASEIIDIIDTFRTACLVRFKYEVTAYEGELISKQVEKDENGNIISIHFTIAAIGSKETLRIGRQMFATAALISEGDFIYAEPASGIIKRVGRSELRVDEYDLEGDKYVPVCNESVMMQRTTTVAMSYYDIDFAYNNRDPNINEFTRLQTDKIIKEYSKLETVELEKSTLVIFNIHNLSELNVIRLRDCLKIYPWVKIIVTGKKEFILQNFAEFLMTDVEEEDAMDVLVSRRGKLNELEKAVAAALPKYGLNIVSSALSASDNLEDFNVIIESQSK